MSLVGDIVTAENRSLFYGESEWSHNFTTSANFEALPLLIRSEYPEYLEYYNIKEGSAYTILFDLSGITSFIDLVFRFEKTLKFTETASFDGFSEFYEKVQTVYYIHQDFLLIIEAIKKFGPCRISWSW